MMETTTFSGVRFALVGFNPIDGNTIQLRSKLVSGGGVDVGQYSQTCTHLIVDKLVYDDPICVAARSSGKVVVTWPWVDHSFDTGMLIDANSVLYRPLKDLNGIPGCKSFVVCLTGYQRQDRDDIMTMVDLMGANFSKPLAANRVTHLICYKFEGEKYELAKRMKRIKLVNHRWLEDCLKNWKLLPEVDYQISGYELEMMEASARDSEDEAEDAPLKRENTSPLGLRVAQTPGGSSLFQNTSKGNWLTPKKTDSPFEAMVSTTDAGVAQQHNHFPRANTSQVTSDIRVADKTPEQGRLSVTEADGSTSVINKSITRHSSLATYSRKTLQRSPETTTTLRKESSALNASTPSNISASKSASSVVFDKIDKLHGHDSPPLVSPQVKFTEGSVSSKGSHEVHRNSEASFLPPAILQDLRPSSPDENFRPLLSIKDPTESAEVGHKTPASVLNTKLLSSNLVPMEDATSTAENIISNCAPDEIPEESLMAGSVLLQEPRPGSPKQNLRAVPNLSDHTAGREAEHKLDVSDSAARLFNSGVVPMEADTENSTLKGTVDEVPEGPVNGLVPVMRRSSTSPGSCFNGIKDEQETELPKKKTAPRKSLGTRGRKKNPINQKISIYLREHSPKDEITDCLDKGNVSAPVTDNVDQKEISSPVPEAAKRTADSETAAFKGIDSADNKSYASKEKDRLVLDMIVNQDNLQAKIPEEADAEVEIVMVEPDLNDVPTKDPSDDSGLLEVDKNKSKRKREATVGQSSPQNGKKESSSTTQVGNSSVKKTKVSRKEHDAKANDTVMKDIVDNFAEEKEKLALETEVGKVSAGGDQSPVAGETLARNEAAINDPSDAVEQLQVEKNKGKRRKEATVEKTWLHSGKKGSSSTVKVSKSCDKKTKISKKECGAKATNAVIEERDRKSGNIGSGGNENLVSGKSLTRKKVAKSANTGTKADKKSKQLSVKPLAGRKVLQDQEYEPKFFTVSGPRSQRNEYQQIIKRLKGKCCRDSHQWSYQATHFIASEIRRTEKFFAAAASGSWILKTDYVADSKEAGKLLPEEPYEWHSSGLSADGAINLEAPRKWRLVREQTGHGALNGLRIVVYGDCTIPSLDTLKRGVKAGDGTILATAPPYTRFLNKKTDFALISPGMPREDVWIQEFIRHEIPCVLSDYIVEYVCKPGYALDKHVLYNTNSWAERSFNKMQMSVLSNSYLM